MEGSWGRGAPEHSAGEMHHPAWGWDLGGGAEGTQKPADGNGLSGGWLCAPDGEGGVRVGERSEK